MMLTIHGLPPNTKFQDLKNIIKQECKITEFILSPLNVDPDGTKRVRIGLADDKEGNLLMKYLDRYRLSGYVLRVVPVGKQTIDNPQQNTFHDGSHQWTGNQQRLDTVQNRPMSWSDGHGNQQWIPNQQAAPLQMQPHSSFSYVQPASGVQQQYFHQQGTHPQNKVFGQQGRFPQVRGMQQQVYGSPKDQSTRNTTSNLITPQRVSQGRPHVLTNVEIIDQHAVRQSAQGSRFQGYNPPDKPVTILKDNFQGPTQHNVGQPNLNQGHYQGQGYGQQWSAQGQLQKAEPFPKHSPLHFDKSGQHEKQQVFHDQGGRRFSPQRDQMTPVVGRRVSPGRRVTPPGHRILPPGRAISPQRRISPSGRKMSPSGRRISPSWRKISPSGRRISPSGRRISPSGRRMSPSGRRMSPPGHRISPSGRRMSPSGRRMSPSGRRMSPSGRRMSPSGRRMSPSGRRMSPSGRRMSPSGRRISPHERRISPPVRKMSPSERRITSPGRKIPQGERHGGHRLSPRRMSPSKQPITRKISPGRHSPNRGHSPRGYDRYSPSRIEKQLGNIRPGPDKTIRPAYEPVPQAQSQPMYPGGYPSNARENVQYPVSGPRQGDRPTWQDREKPYTSSGKPDGDRRDVTRVQKFDGPREYPRGLMNLPETKISSPSRMSRSPTRRDRSPIRDRYRRHSPSPRSPRRSWALEKRRSPENHEAPPPPSWPIPERQEPPYVKPSHPNEKRTGNIAVWDKPYEAKVNPPFPRKEEHLVHEREDRRYFISPSRSRWDLPQTSAAPDLKGPHREPSPRQFRHGDRYPQSQREPKFSSRDEYESQHQNEFQKQGFHERDHHVDRRDSRDIIKQDIDSLRHKTDVLHRRDDYRQRLDESKSGLPIGPDLNREIEDVFKRAAELTKKTEEYQRKRSEKSTKDRDRHVMESKDSRIADHHRTSSPSSRDLYASKETLYNRNQGHPHGPRNFDLSAKIQYKRDKAVDEITGKMMHKFAPDIRGKIRDEVEELVKLSIENMVFEMFGDKDVSFIEIVIKFEDRYRTKDLEQIFDNVLSGFPAEIRRMKRSAPDESHIPAKKQRRSRSPNMKRDMIEPPVESRLSDWNLNFENVMIPAPTLIQQMPIMAPVPMMVPMPYAMSQPELDPMMPQEGYQLFLCKDNFQAFNEMQADYLKDFIVRKIIQATESCNAWAPDLTLRGLQNEIRYEIWTRDEQSKDWLLNMDFNDFSFFNVLVYTSEELWHERAAIWLPDHPRKQILPPLDKLKLQNRFLTNVNIDKWKLVKQIVTEKGTRLYVDMPPSSARALETHKMTLSYELSKVTVFLKAAAVDKNAFDAGLDEKSITVTPDLYKQNTPMPAINSHDLNTVKFCLSGNTPINLATARRIKESIIYNMYKYLQQGGRSKTDFLKYGFCKPGYFCVIPENEESRKWLNVMHFGKINQQFITVYGADNSNVKYISVTMSLPCEPNLTPKNVLEKLKLSNRGVLGLNFHLWKNGFISAQNKRMTYSVDVDLESMETLVSLKLILDYSYNNRNETVFVKSKHSVAQLKEIVNQHRAALDDKQEVVNMEISTSDDESVVCLD